MAMLVAGGEVRSKFKWMERANMSGKSQSLLLGDGTPRGKSGFTDDHDVGGAFL